MRAVTGPGSRSTIAAAVFALLLANGACRTEADSERKFLAQEKASAAALDSTPAGRENAPVPRDRAGSFQLAGTNYSFLVLHCDLAGQGGSGLLVRGTGTLPDGRRMSVQVERIEDGATQDEGVTVVFGGIVEGDHWRARRVRFPDGRWFADEMGTRPVEGPLIEITGSELRAKGVFERESDDAERPGVLRAACPA